jgi:hypothetical protein
MFSLMAKKYTCQDVHYGGNSRRSSNTMKAHTKGSILRQYFFDTNYFQLLMGLRSFQKSVFLNSIIFIFPEKYLKLKSWLNSNAIIVFY